MPEFTQSQLALLVAGAEEYYSYPDGRLRLFRFQDYCYLIEIDEHLNLTLVSKSQAPSVAEAKALMNLMRNMDAALSAIDGAAGQPGGIKFKTPDEKQAFMDQSQNAHLN